VLSSNEVYYTDDRAKGKNFFENFSDLVIGDIPNDYPMTTTATPMFWQRQTL